MRCREQRRNVAASTTVMNAEGVGADFDLLNRTAQRNLLLSLSFSPLSTPPPAVNRTSPRAGLSLMGPPGFEPGTNGL